MESYDPNISPHLDDIAPRIVYESGISDRRDRVKR